MANPERSPRLISVSTMLAGAIVGLLLLVSAGLFLLDIPQSGQGHIGTIVTALTVALLKAADFVWPRRTDLQASSTVQPPGQPPPVQPPVT